VLRGHYGTNRAGVLGMGPVRRDTGPRDARPAARRKGLLRFASYAARFAERDLTALRQALRAEFGESQFTEDKGDLHLQAWTWPDGTNLGLTWLPSQRPVAGEWVLIWVTSWWGRAEGRRTEERARRLCPGLR
jgi:hypothetical protein